MSVLWLTFGNAFTLLTDIAVNEIVYADLRIQARYIL